MQLVSKASTLKSPALAGKGPVLTPIKPLGKSQQLATKGEAAVQVGLSDQQAAKSLAGLKQKVAQFSRGDKKAFRKVYRQELAKAYDANRKIGKGALSVQQHEKAYYTAYQNIFQAQQDALRAAAQEELAAYMLSGAPQTPGRVIRHIPWRVRASADISAAWNAVKSSLPWFASKDGAVASLSALAIGNPSVGMATTQAGTLAQGLRAPIAITTIFNEYKQPIHCVDHPCHGRGATDRATGLYDRNHGPRAARRALGYPRVYGGGRPFKPRIVPVGRKRICRL